MNFPCYSLRKLLLALACILVFEPLAAQKPLVKMGAISEAEWALTSVPFDSSADAVILYNYAECNYLPGGNGAVLVTEHHVRIKILRPGGLEAADVAIPLYFNGDATEKVNSLKAFTYTRGEDGKVVETQLEREGKFSDAVSDNLRLYRFTMPNVQPGAIIEYRYKVESAFIFYLDSWYFQEAYPVLHSELRAHIPEPIRYRFMIHGSPRKMDEQEIKTMAASGGGLGYPENWGRWVMKNVPAYREEDFVASVENYRTRIDFEVSGLEIPGRFSERYPVTWPAIGAKLMTDETFGKTMEKCRFAEDMMAKMKENYPDEAERAAAIYRLVQKRVKWNGAERLFASRPLEKAWEERSGSSADINLLLVALFRQAGLSADPVIVRTRDNGYITHASPQQVNYVIAGAVLAGKLTFFDATDPYLTPGLLPIRVLNYEGIRIMPAGVETVNLEPKKGDTFQSLCIASISEEGIISGNLNTTRRDYAALAYRKAVLQETLDKHISGLSSRIEAQISDYQLAPLDSAHSSITETFRFEFAEGRTQGAGDYLYFYPLLHLRMENNPFEQETRQYPIEFPTPLTQSFTLNLSIPAGYEVLEQPANSVIRLPDNSAAFTYSIQKTEEGIALQSQFQIKRVAFSPEEYSDLKKFYAFVIAKQGEALVLRKL